MNKAVLTNPSAIISMVSLTTESPCGTAQMNICLFTLY